jgi:hypothetical protein
MGANRSLLLFVPVHQAITHRTEPGDAGTRFWTNKLSSLLFWDIQACPSASSGSLHHLQIIREFVSDAGSGSPECSCSRRISEFAAAITNFPLESSSHLKHYAKTRFAAHHAVVSFCSLVQRVFFDHWQHPADLAEPERVFGIDGRATRPALN